MTVKSLTHVQKLEIAVSFTSGRYNIEQLATIYNRSKRTIDRVLEEHNCSPTKKRKPKVKPVPVTIPTKTPWYRRFFTAVGQGIGIV